MPKTHPYRFTREFTDSVFQGLARVCRICGRRRSVDDDFSYSPDSCDYCHNNETAPDADVDGLFLGVEYDVE